MAKIATPFPRTHPIDIPQAMGSLTMRFDGTSKIRSNPQLIWTMITHQVYLIID